MPAQIGDLQQQRHIDALNNIGLSYPTLAEGTNAATIKIGTRFDYMIAGQMYSKAITDNIAITATGVVANGTTTYYLISINAAGTVVLTAPAAARAGDPDTTGLLLGALPAGNVCMGIMKVVATAAYTPGTTDLAGQGTFAHIRSYPKDGDPTVFTYA